MPRPTHGGSRPAKRLLARRATPHPLSAPATVTVVIPCYNYARYLPAAIGSALRQVDVQVDVIVVDDCSTDDSAAVAESIAASDSRVRVLRNRVNSGPVDTFNAGLAQARGEFLVRLDADDLLTPGSLERAVALLQRHPSVGLVYGHPLHFEGDELPAPRETVTGWTIWLGADWLRARCEAGDNVITSPEVVMRRSVVDRVGGQRPLAHTHDMEMWLRIAAHSDIAYVEGADQAWHRDHPASLSLRADDPRVILNEIRDAFDVLCVGLRETAGGVSPTAEEIDALHDSAIRAVARQALAYARRDVDRGRESELAVQLSAFAVACDPTIDRSPAGRAYARALDRARRLPAPLARAIGMLPRLRRRWRDRVRAARWRRSGVYEPQNVRDYGAERRTAGGGSQT